MLISHTKKFIFIKTSKTAGTSVELYFEPYCIADDGSEVTEDRDQVMSEYGIVGGRGSGKCDVLHSHMPAKSIKTLVSDEQWQTYLKFTVVRNPFDRLVSRYFFNRKVKEGRSLLGVPDEQIIDDFRNFAKNTYFPLLGQVSLGPRLAVDKVIRFESLPQGVEDICTHLDIPFDESRIPKLKTGIRDSSFSFAQLYDKETVNKVTELYKSELEFFNYSFEQLTY